MIELREEHLQVRETARKFADEVVAPRAREIDEKEEFPRDVVTQMAELGFLGLPYPEKYGGAGLDTLAYAIAVEEISRVCASTGITLAAHVSLGCGPVFAFGSRGAEDQVPGADGEGRGDRSLRAHRAERRLGRGRHADARREGRGRLARQRLEDLHHQRQRGEVHHLHRAHRGRERRCEGHLGLHHGHRNARLPRRQAREEDGTCAARTRSRWCSRTASSPTRT